MNDALKICLIISLSIVATTVWLITATAVTHMDEYSQQTTRTCIQRYSPERCTVFKR